MRARREYLRMSQGDVADLFSCHRVTISQYERGERDVNAEDLSRLAEILKVPVSYFYGDDDIEGPIISSYYEGLSPMRKNTADEVIRALWLEDQRSETTHGKKAE